jgi:hypothetical protein
MNLRKYNSGNVLRVSLFFERYLRLDRSASLFLLDCKHRIERKETGQSNLARFLSNRLIRLKP